MQETNRVFGGHQLWIALPTAKVSSAEKLDLSWLLYLLEKNWNSWPWVWHSVASISSQCHKSISEAKSAQWTLAMKFCQEMQVLHGDLPDVSRCPRCTWNRLRFQCKHGGVNHVPKDLGCECVFCFMHKTYIMTYMQMIHASNYGDDPYLSTSCCVRVCFFFCTWVSRGWFGKEPRFLIREHQRKVTWLSCGVFLSLEHDLSRNKRQTTLWSSTCEFDPLRNTGNHHVFFCPCFFPIGFRRVFSAWQGTQCLFLRCHSQRIWEGRRWVALLWGMEVWIVA